MVVLSGKEMQPAGPEESQQSVSFPPELTSHSTPLKQFTSGEDEKPTGSSLRKGFPL